MAVLCRCSWRVLIAVPFGRGASSYRPPALHRLASLQKDDFLQQLQPLVLRLNERGSTWTAKQLAALLSGFQQFMEDALGVNVSRASAMDAHCAACNSPPPPPLPPPPLIRPLRLAPRSPSTSPSPACRPT